MEQQNKVPEGKEIFRPNPGFVIKTRDNTQNKVFINLCSHDKVGKMELKKVVQNGKVGMSSSIPLMVGPIRMENDKQNKPCATVDVCFNPETITKCTFTQQIMNAVCITAIENAEKRFIENDPKSTLERTYHVLKNVTCKGEKPSIFMIGKKEESNSNKSQNNKNKTNTPPPSSPSTNNNNKDNNNPIPPPTTTTAAAAENDDKPPVVDEYETTKDKDKTSTTLSPQNFPLSPKYTIIYCGNIELSDMYNDPRVCSGKNIPKELVIKIELPLLNGISNVELDINEKSLKLSCKEYLLDIPSLPYQVDEEKGSAKFDKKTKVLQVVLPVIPPKVNTQIVTDKKETEEEEEDNDDDTSANEEDNSNNKKVEVEKPIDHSYFINK